MKKSSIETTVGVFVLIGLLCVGYLTIKLGKMELLSENYYHVNASFTSATGLKSGGNVEMAGVKVGQIDKIELDPIIKVAQVRLKIDNEVELATDVIASIKTAGIIGDKYISLTPGGEEEVLANGDTIEETESSLDIEDLVSKYVFGDKE